MDSTTPHPDSGSGPPHLDPGPDIQPIFQLPIQPSIEPSTSQPTTARLTAVVIPAPIQKINHPTSSNPRKRARKVSFHGAFQPLQDPTTPKEAIQMALGLIIKAADMYGNNNSAERTKVLNLMEIFRDYTETGRVNNKTTDILASHVADLGKAARVIGTKTQQLKTTPAIPILKSISQTVPQSTPQPTLVSTSQSKATYAAAAASNNNNTWQTVPSRKPAVQATKSKTQPSLKDRQLVLQRNSHQPIDPLLLRNEFNMAFKSKGQSTPVVASVKESNKQNIVLTTTPTFTGKFLLENKSVWQHIVKFEEALLIKPWFKVAIHNIPTNQDLAVLKDEIPTFNKGLKIVGNPYWLTSAERRQTQLTGTACIAFSTEKEAKQAISQKLFVLGVSVRAEKLHSTPPSTQCTNCQKFGHFENKCKGTTACRICGKGHSTSAHKCNTCSTKGKTCVHTLPLCANCKGPHTADNSHCEVFLATKTPKPTSDTSMWNSDSNTQEYQF